jgi:HSP20 family protein
MELTLWRPPRYYPVGWESGDWLDDFFGMEDMFPRSYTADRYAGDGGYFPPMESYAKGNELHLRAELPGVDPKDVDISLRDGHLCIRGERKRNGTGEDACYCFEEMHYGNFSRCFHVPRNLDAEKIHAEYDNGMLELTIPLEEPAAEKKIPIKGTKAARKKLKTA